MKQIENLKECWAVSGTTESGDDLNILLFSHQPTHKEVEEAYKKIMRGEVKYASWTISQPIWGD